MGKESLEGWTAPGFSKREGLVNVDFQVSRGHEAADFRKLLRVLHCAHRLELGTKPKQTFDHSAHRKMASAMQQAREQLARCCQADRTHTVT